MSQIEETEQSEQTKPKTITIHIDRATYKVEEASLTGLQIRAIPVPAIGPEFDLYQIVPGPADDVLVGDSDVIELKEGMHFFTAPRHINPGRRR